MSFTYAQLKQAIQDYCENDETSFVSNLPIFIRNTEERILKNVQLSLFRKTYSGTFTASNQLLSVPTDFLAPLSFSYTGPDSSSVFLDFKDADYIKTFNPNPSNEGLPRAYAILDVDNFIIGPTPNSNYAIELQYFYRPASLSAGAEGSTTWLSENAPMTMLYGCLVEAYTYMKGEPDILQLYQQQFVQGLQP